MSHNLKPDEMMLTVRVKKKFAKNLTRFAQGFSMTRSELIRSLMSAVMNEYQSKKISGKNHI